MIRRHALAHVRSSFCRLLTAQDVLQHVAQNKTVPNYVASADDVLNLDRQVLCGFYRDAQLESELLEQLPALCTVTNTMPALTGQVHNNAPSIPSFLAALGASQTHRSFAEFVEYLALFDVDNLIARGVSVSSSNILCLLPSNLLPSVIAQGLVLLAHELDQEAWSEQAEQVREFIHVHVFDTLFDYETAKSVAPIWERGNWQNETETDRHFEEFLEHGPLFLTRVAQLVGVFNATGDIRCLRALLRIAAEDDAAPAEAAQISDDAAGALFLALQSDPEMSQRLAEDSDLPSQQATLLANIMREITADSNQVNENAPQLYFSLCGLPSDVRVQQQWAQWYEQRFCAEADAEFRAIERESLGHLLELADDVEDSDSLAQ
ncbi:MAG: hypothetical protein MHM6MM_002426 [Cercozoa sp. M6MM]